MTDLCCFSFKRRQSTYISYFLKLKTIANNVTYFFLYLYMENKMCPILHPLSNSPMTKVVNYISNLLIAIHYKHCKMFSSTAVVISFRVLSGFRSILENRRIQFCISLPVLLHSRNSRGWEQSFCLEKHWGINLICYLLAIRCK